MFHNLKTKKCCNNCCNIQFVENFKENKKIKWEEDINNIPNKAGVIIFEKKNKKYLLIQSFGNLWGFPKGSKNKNEDLRECAKRELLEETNIDIPLKHFVKYIDIKINEQYARYYYLELSQEYKGKISIKKNIDNFPNDSTGYPWIKAIIVYEIINIK